MIETKRSSSGRVMSELGSVARSRSPVRGGSGVSVMMAVVVMLSTLGAIRPTSKIQFHGGGVVRFRAGGAHHARTQSGYAAARAAGGPVPAGDQVRTARERRAGALIAGACVDARPVPWPGAGSVRAAPGGGLPGLTGRVRDPGGPGRGQDRAG